MKVHRIVSAGTATELALHRAPYTFHMDSATTSLFPPAIPDDIVGTAIAKSNDYVYTWYSSGFVSRGTSWNLVQRGEPYTYTLPAGKTPKDIIDMDSGLPDDRIFTWYRDGTFSIGSSRNLGEHQPAGGHPYTLPAPYAPDDIVGIGIAAQNNTNRVYAWYKDGKVSVGAPTNLAQFETPTPYSSPVGATYSDIRGMAIAGSNQWVYVWYVAEGKATGDLMAVDWCYAIDTGTGMGRPVTITFYPMIKNVGSFGWSSPNEGLYRATVSWTYVEAKHSPIAGYPHWFIGPNEIKILTPGVTVPFHPANDYHFAWSFEHPDDQNAGNNGCVDPTTVKGKEFEGNGTMVHKRRQDVTLLSPYT